MAAAGWIFDIQRFSLHDGPGIRTIVFLQGCPLRCRWCHNPEGWVQGANLAYAPARCIGCARCAGACPAGAHRIDGSQHGIDRSACNACGNCVAACPSKALEVVGRRMSTEEIIDEVAADLPFYENSGGGMTLSGGEPLQQAAFSLQLLKAAKARKINTCVETSGFGKTADLLALAMETDLFLFDIKHTDDRLHQRQTGVSNRTIISNLEELCRSGAKIRLRLPWIPGVNDTDAHISGVAEIFQRYEAIECAEIIPYHAIGVSKNRRFGNSFGVESFRSPEKEGVEIAKAALRMRGVRIYGLCDREA